MTTMNETKTKVEIISTTFHLHLQRNTIYIYKGNGHEGLAGYIAESIT